MKIDHTLTPADLARNVERLFELAIPKILTLDRTWQRSNGTPVFTVNGQYTSRGWTEWTEGFQYGCALLAFDGTDQQELLELGRRRTLDHMASHVTHTGVHDHAFNNLSTYGNLWRLMNEGRIPENPWERAFYELALKSSGAVQAARWSDAEGAGGYIYSFNGPHSLFVDTLRTLRILDVAHQLGHVLMGENDRKISLLERSITHGMTTASYNLYYGTHRDAYDLPEDRGRTAHEALFNTNDGRFRAPNAQQGYSGFTTWTRGLAWAMLGFAEQLEFLIRLDDSQFTQSTKSEVLATYEKAATATCDFYIHRASASDGICYWDTGAPGLSHMGDWRAANANPFNNFEPVDASASAIAAQGLLRLGNHLGTRGTPYTQAGLTIAKTLLSDPYLSTSDTHQGLLLHSIYHRPNNWDHTPPGQKIPSGESSLWGDYHLLELGILLQRLQRGQYLQFFDNAQFQS